MWLQFSNLRYDVDKTWTLICRSASHTHERKGKEKGLPRRKHRCFSSTKWCLNVRSSLTISRRTLWEGEIKMFIHFYSNAIEILPVDTRLNAKWQEKDRPYRNIFLLLLDDIPSLILSHSHRHRFFVTVPSTVISLNLSYLSLRPHPYYLRPPLPPRPRHRPQQLHCLTVPAAPPPLVSLLPSIETFRPSGIEKLGGIVMEPGLWVWTWLSGGGRCQITYHAPRYDSDY